MAAIQRKQRWPLGPLEYVVTGLQDQHSMAAMVPIAAMPMWLRALQKGPTCDASSGAGSPHLRASASERTVIASSTADSA